MGKDDRVEYRLYVSYPGYHPKYDTQIEHVVKRGRDGSGYSLDYGVRDLGFTFYHKSALDAAVKRVRGMKPKKRGTKVTVYVEDGRLPREIK